MDALNEQLATVCPYCNADLVSSEGYDHHVPRCVDRPSEDDYSVADRALADAYVATVTETGVDGPSQEYALQTGAAMMEWLTRHGFVLTERPIRAASAAGGRY